MQTEAIPAVLSGADLLASARTGSGKTAAFCLPLLQRWHDKRHIGLRRPLYGLILVPTRELAAQVGEVLAGLARQLPDTPKIVVAFGGVSINPQLMNLRGGADFVVATPGRLLDLIDHNALHLDDVATLVLDEADRLLDLGFAEEIGRILAYLPSRRQNLFFSATFPNEVQRLARHLLHEPVRVEVETEVVGQPDILQRAIEVDEDKRTALLLHLLKAEGWQQVLVFVATKIATERVAEKLQRAGIAAVALHGEQSQGTRSSVLAGFRAGHATVLVATDLAARGIDIAELPVVLNYDLPRSSVDYTHRIGRTGRAGERGMAVSFVSAASEAHFRLIEKRQAQRVPREQVAGFAPELQAVTTATLVAEDGGGIKGKRKSKKDKLREAAAQSGKDPV
ncbi:DEAD/DEAH box helicase [Chitinimonas naiadis]